MERMIQKRIEYEIVYTNHSVDHVDWRTAKKMLENPATDVLLIERVTRYGDEAEEFDERRTYETLFERDEDEN